MKRSNGRTGSNSISRDSDTELTCKKNIVNIVAALIVLFSSSLVAAQSQPNANKEIIGEVISKPVIADTVFFTYGSIDKKYYRQSLDSGFLKSNHYVVPNDLTYPMMFKIAFASEKGIRTWRTGDYFIDSSTTRIKTDNQYDNCNEVNGATANEYQHQFIPFVTKGNNYNCKSDELSDLFYDSNPKADTLLLNYIKVFPNSYVGLWKLIERFNSYGQSSIRQQALASFSNKIKQGVLWTILDKDFKETKIKEGEVFPSVALKTIDLKPTKLILPKAKYILIDFWFARCRPCLDTIPALKKLYNSYKAKGFEIVSISVDETVNVPIWQKRIKEHGLVWTQYLEENNFRSNELGIKSYPTFILLNDKGIVINKDFDLHYLDSYLNKNL